MNQNLKCLRCQTPMEEGYIVDSTYGGVVPEQWTPGAAESSFWGGLKMKGKPLLQVSTLRCPKCGYLESYA